MAADKHFDSDRLPLIPSPLHYSYALALVPNNTPIGDHQHSAIDLHKTGYNYTGGQGRADGLMILHQFRSFSDDAAKGGYDLIVNLLPPIKITIEPRPHAPTEHADHKSGRGEKSYF